MVHSLLCSEGTDVLIGLISEASWVAIPMHTHYLTFGALVSKRGTNRRDRPADKVVTSQYITQVVWRGVQILVDAIDEVVEILLVITDAVGMHSCPHPAQVIAQCHTSCGATAPARLCMKC